MWFEPDSVNDSCIPHWQLVCYGAKIRSRGTLLRSQQGPQSAAIQLRMPLIEATKAKEKLVLRLL